ncbi:MAG: hypothetical protein U0U46_01355 [Saprospiraceae bacterium]
MKYPLLLAGVVGILAVTVGATVQLPLKPHRYEVPPDYPQKMLGLEFLPDSSALEVFFGASEPQRSSSIGAMRSALMRDNFFAASYTLFMLVFAVSCWAITRKKTYWMMALLAVWVGLSDFMENTLTIRLLDHLRAPDWQVQMKQMHFWVASKGLGLLLLLAGAAVFLWSAGRVGKVLALLAAVAVLAGFLSLTWIGFVNWSGLLGLKLFFPLLVVYCFYFRR